VTDALVDNIVSQVMAALRAQGVAAYAPARPVPPRLPAARDATAVKSSAPPQRAFLTAAALERRMAAEPGDGRVIELAANEFLTPAARDVVDERHLTVRRAPQALPSPASSSPNATVCEAARNPGPAAVGLVIERAGQTVTGVLTALKRDGLALVDYTQTDCWIANTRRLCEAVLAREVCLGVAILPYAADAMVLANKVRGIRAVQGSRPDGVAAAVRHFAPNLLVLEHTLNTYHEMRAMVRTFSAERPGEPRAKVLMEALAELERS